ncbi:hypothetical protein G7046_g9188 [Stylonectria norvegica]|nr:hypothetical protein G7046_g9188 [Stylonectria norvegica]
MAETTAQPDADLGRPQFSHHGVVEPIIIVAIMVSSCYINRRRGYRIWPPTEQNRGLLDQKKLEPSEKLFMSTDSSTSTNRAPKKRNCCGIDIYTPNTSRYSNYFHSRFIQKFPFLVEMFYWAINLLFYVLVKPITEKMFSTEGVWKTAEKHGVAMLSIEHKGPFRFIFPQEVDVQMWFRTGHQELLTILNRAYSLIHIPVTVSFLAWYYYASPTHEEFASARRMMTLANLFAFGFFTFFPCMPPRLLPEQYGFFDTVRRENAESIWATGKFFDRLAAFPSLHFAYATCIGGVLAYHSGVFRRRRGPRGKRVFFATLSVVYPCFVLAIIVSTANHYWLDALASMGVVAVAWACNRSLLVLLPLEDIFLWLVKLEKPVPTTGNRG